MQYYAQRKSVRAGVPQAVVNKYGTRREMERQFHLFCANACDGEEFVFDVDAIEWGTVEQGALERVVYRRPEAVEEAQGE